VSKTTTRQHEIYAIIINSSLNIWCSNTTCKNWIGFL